MTTFFFPMLLPHYKMGDAFSFFPILFWLMMLHVVALICDGFSFLFRFSCSLKDSGFCHDVFVAMLRSGFLCHEATKFSLIVVLESFFT
jgi:hypothetical protein